MSEETRPQYPVREQVKAEVPLYGTLTHKMGKSVR